MKRLQIVDHNINIGHCKVYSIHNIFFRNAEFGIRNLEFGIRNSEFGIRNSELRSLMNHKILVTKSVEYTLQ